MSHMSDWVFSMSLKSSLYWKTVRKTLSFFFFPLKSFLTCVWIKEKIYQVWLHLSRRRCSQDPKWHLYQSMLTALNGRSLSNCCRQSSVVQKFSKRRVCWKRISETTFSLQSPSLSPFLNIITCQNETVKEFFIWEERKYLSNHTHSIILPQEIPLIAKITSHSVFNANKRFFFS